MKVVVACNGEKVSQHFGHCGQFTVYNIEDNKVVSKEVLAYPGHKPGLLPTYLSDNGANIVIAGGMGGSAVEMFNERGIEVIMGSLGTSDDVIAEYLAGNLKSTGSACSDHSFEDDSCNE